ncbi:membrane protein [Mycolicibacterium aromaticivorans JS19b1 = JCM 16368]|uniref:Membrane protein n=1 Tax=Mycolicibacterium aromaticivorans JS19b1 = JCM 16368 TaxID=1440774 RepID=A0A064CK64_9MYCO|nr:DUF456 domain-containing protein [Mycolicibacterium aromaticivorans]KDF00062.1 membrane protein [Mycolicibacterium aromaticivorans JS19b1 = JCM 16368]
MSTGGVVLVGLAIAVGLVGVIVPLLPGTLLVYAAIAGWAAVEHSLVSWVVLGMVTVVLGAGLLIKYLWPARRMRAGEVGRWTLAAGAALGVIGFFVVPVIGLVFGFVLGVYLAELASRRDQRRAWAATVLALKAAALSVGVELTGGLIATAVWVAGLLLTQ